MQILIADPMLDLDIQELASLTTGGGDLENFERLFSKLKEMKDVFGVLGFFKQEPEKFAEEVREKYLSKIGLEVNYIADEITKRAEAKKEKNFEVADKIRTDLDSKGIILNDTINGTKWDIKELY